MKKLIIPLIILLIVILAVVLLLLFYSAKDYLLIKKSGKYYISLDERYHESVSCCDIAPVIFFDSVAEMKNRILFGDFTEEELKEIGRFYMEDGLIPITDISKLYEPLYPDDFNGYTVSWTGSNYYYTFYNTDHTRWEYLTISSSSYYPEHIEKLMDYKNQYTEFLSSECILEKVVSEADRNATAFYFKRPGHIEFKVVIYQFKNRGTTFTIYEKYELDKSDSVPRFVKVYGDYQGMYFYFSMYDLEERPSVEWLSQFGIKKFEG